MSKTMNMSLASETGPQNSELVQWLPVLLWGAAIFILSSSFFSSANTGKIITPILEWLIPGISAATVAVVHGLIRKSAHFANYGILFWLLIRGPLPRRPYVALLLCVAYAFLDEGHQIFVPGRTPSLYDVALDSTGALFSKFLNAALSELA